MHITPELMKFFSVVDNRAREHGVERTSRLETHLPLPNSPETLVNGYFVDSPRRMFGVATAKPLPEWLSVYVHESSHMDQCIEESAAWKERLVPGTTLEAFDVVQLWVGRKIELTPEQLSAYIHRARSVEWDCEKRSATKIREFSLPIDEQEYIRKANSYLYFYTALKELRAWYAPGGEPYNTPEIYTYCPGVFLPEKAYEYVPLALMDRYRKLLSK